MRRRLAALLAAGLMAVSLVGCAGTPDPAGSTGSFEAHIPLQAGEELELWFVSDLHLLSEQLTDYSPEFLTMLAKGDGKTAQYSPEIGRALVWEITSLPEAERPDALLAAGDLTFNGERLSHEEAAGLFEEIEAAGVPVLTLPGNHDLNNALAYRYDGNTATKVESLSADGFRELYGEFGYRDSFSRDPESFSYAFELAEDFWVVAIDGNTDSHSGWVDQKTLDWLDGVLTQAEEQHAAVLTFSHQNLVRHNARFPYGYTFGNSMAVRDVLLEHGVKLNLSGHIHIQHMGEYDGLREVTTSALSIAENHIGVLRVAADRQASYAVRQLDVAGYARAMGLTDPSLEDFPAYTADYFRENSMRGASERLDELQVPEEERALMLEAAGEFNLRYFTGRAAQYREELMALPGYALWQAQPESQQAEYFDFILETEKQDETQADFPALWTGGEDDDAVQGGSV